MSFLKNKTVSREFEILVLIFILHDPPDRTIMGLLWIVSNKFWHSSFRVLTYPICYQYDETDTYFRRTEDVLSSRNPVYAQTQATVVTVRQDTEKKRKKLRRTDTLFGTPVL